MISQTKCPCCSGKDFADCCEPFLNKTVLPSSPEALMRSRYSAYVLKNPQYILDTTHPSKRKYHRLEDIIKWSTESHWIRLEVISALKDRVKFKAYYRDKWGNAHIHVEHSQFKREKGIWYFYDAEY